MLPHVKINNDWLTRSAKMALTSDY